MRISWAGLIVISFLMASCSSTRRQVPLTDGAVLQQSGVVRLGTYALAGREDRPAIRIVGDDLTIDFQGAVLTGSAEGTLPDEYAGTGVEVRGANITIKNLVVRGYKVGLIARDCPNLRLTQCDFSYNWKQHLKSTLEREDLSDWLSFHHNEQDEWLRYGAGIYLQNCDGAKIDHCTIVGGQNGLMMSGCDQGMIYNNNFSFLSGLGLGMYRSSRNTVMHNKLDWCVRGYSHGVYNRGQDSAGILVYEQSSNNVFAYNSVTHGGDGFFLWAGQTTMDNGQGGCNDNLLYGNDFSHAPTNGIEVTFSRNQIIANRVDECDHGIWGGYSYDTLIVGNSFANNNRAIAIEHGQNNTISHNLFNENPVHIDLWANATQDPNWGYVRYRDTRSRGYAIEHNQFTGGKVALRARETSKIGGTMNAVSNVKTAFDIQGGVDNAMGISSQAENTTCAAITQYKPKPLAGGMDAMLPADHPRGRKYILVDEWGPYDFKSPKLWLRQPMDRNRAMTFEILGPKGQYKVMRSDGVASVSSQSGSVPGELAVTVAPGAAVDVNLELEYTGQAITSPLGKKIAAGQAYRFGFRKFEVPIDWLVKFYTYDNATEPREKSEAFYKLLAGPAVKEERTVRLDYASAGAFTDGVPADHFAAVAEGNVTLPAGDYALEVTSDDGVRVYVDGKRVIDNWSWHVPTLDKAELQLSGQHRIRVEYFEIDGYATLKLDLKRLRSGPPLQ
ncbi:MAG TPA: right-handed parallel beta-helix repeat-containing protein [Tepidisphaeraceae bacterium]|nr:right-handed parallel beta-helix repeat-containing protein [Tepidisphaeraceae bacterium]